MTDNLVAFLRARLDELADAAREEIEYRKSLPDLTGAAVVIPPLMWVGWDDPPFVLAEVEVKRRIINEIAPSLEAAIEKIENEWVTDWRPGRAEDLLQLLALPYAGHTDYRDEWRP